MNFFREHIIVLAIFRARNMFYCFCKIFFYTQLIFLGSTLVWQKLYHITIPVSMLNNPANNQPHSFIIVILLQILQVILIVSISFSFFIGKQSKKNKTLMVYFGMASHSSSKIWMNEVWNYHLAVAKSFRPGLKRRGLLNLYVYDNIHWIIKPLN